MKNSISIIVTLLLTSACGYIDPPKQISYYVYDKENQIKQTSVENELLKEFFIAGGGDIASVTNTRTDKNGDAIATYSYKADDWWTIINGAKYRIDKSCNDYLSKLNRIDNERKTELAALAIGGPALTAVSTTAGASRDALTYLAAALGIVGAAPDLAADHFLYGASPAALSTMVENARRLMWTGLQDVHTNGGLRNRPSALGGIEAYMRICMPETIRAMADQALEGAKPKLATMTPSGEAVPVVQAPRRTATTSDGNLPVVRFNLE